MVIAKPGYGGRRMVSRVISEGDPTEIIVDTELSDPARILSHLDVRVPAGATVNWYENNNIVHITISTNDDHDTVWPES